MTNSFGLRESDLSAMHHVLEKYADVAQAYIFGSRAKGNYQTGSDVDIALKGEQLTHQTVRNISYELNEETNMPYKFDVLNFHTITEPALVEHISRVGQVFYEKQPQTISE